jgi:predicted lysophospholipase L1 biosynthesis ABC-type transport system permease subunit
LKPVYDSLLSATSPPALIAVVLAAMGLYGVLSYAIVQRTREIGIRAALGASRGSLIALVVRQGMVMAGLGLALGCGGAISPSSGAPISTASQPPHEGHGS